MSIDPNDIHIHAELREEPDAEQLALAIIDLLPLLDRATREQLEIVGDEIRRRMAKEAKAHPEPRP